MPAKKPAPKKAAPAKKPAAKPAPAKKAAPAKKPAAKPAPAKKPAAKPAPKAAPSANASYHLSKRSDGKWQLFITGSDKVIKLFDTKAEGEAYAKEKAANTGRAVLAHNSKGANKGKIKSK